MWRIDVRRCRAAGIYANFMARIVAVWRVLILLAQLPSGV
jgi:hypothetical protein